MADRNLVLNLLITARDQFSAIFGNTYGTTLLNSNTNTTGNVARPQRRSEFAAKTLDSVVTMLSMFWLLVFLVWLVRLWLHLGIAGQLVVEQAFK